MFEKLLTFIAEEEKEILKKARQRSVELEFIISMLEEDLEKQRQLLRREEEKRDRIYHKAKLLMHANCNHEWGLIHVVNNIHNCPTYEWCRERFDHYHEECSICKLVKGGPCYGY